MSRLRPFRSRVGVAGAAGLAALSLLVTSLTPLALRASAAEESTQATDVVSSQDGATASSDSEAAAAPAAEAGVEAPAADTDTAGADAADADAGSEAPAAEVAPEDQPRTRRARSTSAKPATLAMTVTNDSSTLAIRDKQITTINYACSSVTTPCEGASIEVLLPAPVTPAGTALTDKLYTAVAVTGSTVLRTEQTTVAGNPRMKRLLFPLQRSIPAGTSDRIQITWTYDGNDAPNNSTTTQQVNFTALNADSLEDSQTTKWTADTDIAIEKSGPTNPNNYPAVGGETTYKLRYGYQQIDQTNPNKVGIRWNGSSQKNGVNATNFVQVQDIKVVDPLPAQAEFVSATNGGVYDAGTHTVTWSYDKWAWQNPIESLVTVKYPEGSRRPTSSRTRPPSQLQSRTTRRPSSPRALKSHMVSQCVSLLVVSPKSVTTTSTRCARASLNGDLVLSTPAIRRHTFTSMTPCRAHGPLRTQRLPVTPATSPPW